MSARFNLIHDMILEQAAASPGALAAVAGDDELTYGALVERAMGVAGQLHRNGVRPGDVVGLSCSRSTDGLVGLLGILAAGAAYLYLDPALPSARMRYMLDQCAVRVVAIGSRAQHVPESRSVIWLAETTPPAAVNGHRPAGAAPADIAYVVYTSGSTGSPRGVAVEHAGVSNMVCRLAAALGVGEGTRMLQFSSWSWDASAVEILVPLAVGGCVVIAPDRARGGGDDLAAFLRRSRVNVTTLTPSVLAATPARGLPDLRTVAAVGETCPSEVVTRWSAPGRRFLNGYGPTEATVAVSIGQCHPGAEVHIGAPLEGVHVRVVDEHGQPVSDGQPGRLLVAGVGLARGYVVDHVRVNGEHPRIAVADSGRFFVDGEGVRWFHTGDLVRWTTGGNLVHLGRLDDQVQLHGHRIELGEVEQTLRRHRAVRACAVTVHAGRLIAFVVADAEPTDLEHGLERGPERDLAHDLERGPERDRERGLERDLKHDIARTAREWLPPHMIPEIEVVERLPLNANGKLDRRRLASLVRSTAAGPPPETAAADHRPDEVLELVLGTVRRLIGVEVVPEEDFFASGGHSLLAAELSIALSTGLGIDVPVLTVVDNPTAAKLASVLRGLRAAEPADQAAPLGGAGDCSWRLPLGAGTHLTGTTTGKGRPTVVLLHGGSGNHRWWDPVAARLKANHETIRWDHRGHGLSGPAGGSLGVGQLAADTLAVLAAHDLTEVVLVGHSLGATVALAAAAEAEPGRVAAVVCVEGGLYDLRLLYGSTWQEARERLRLSRRQVTPAVLAAWLDSIGLPPDALPAVAANYIDTGDGRMTLRLPAEMEEQLAHSLWSLELSTLLPSIRQPVAIIAAAGPHHGAGPEDRATRVRRESVASARALLPGGLTEVWMAGDHYLPLQHPQAVAASIEELISRIVRRASPDSRIPVPAKAPWVEKAAGEPSLITPPVAGGAV
jgi:amino acid adenylation domain-containing protein